MSGFVDYSKLRHPNQDALDHQVAACRRVGIVVTETHLEPVTGFTGWAGLNRVRVTLVDPENGMWRVQCGEPGPVRRWWRRLWGRS